MQLTPRLFVSCRDGMVHIANVSDLWVELDNALPIPTDEAHRSLVLAMRENLKTLNDWWPKHMDALADQFTANGPISPQSETGDG